MKATLTTGAVIKGRLYPAGPHDLDRDALNIAKELGVLAEEVETPKAAKAAKASKKAPEPPAPVADAPQGETDTADQSDADAPQGETAPTADDGQTEQ